MVIEVVPFDRSLVGIHDKYAPLYIVNEIFNVQ